NPSVNLNRVNPQPERSTNPSRLRRAWEMVRPTYGDHVMWTAKDAKVAALAMTMSTWRVMTSEARSKPSPRPSTKVAVRPFGTLAECCLMEVVRDRLIRMPLSSQDTRPGAWYPGADASVIPWVIQ